MSIISISNLTFAYDGSYDNVFENVSFQIDTDWKLGLIGRNGRGKTTFLRLLMGQYEHKGSITSSVSFDYFPFEVSNKTQATEQVIAAIAPDALRWQVIRELSLIDVGDEVLIRPFATLSPGEQTKVLLAVLFLKKNNFLLIDEPTNHLDVNTRQTVCDYLKKKKGFILISHDRNILDNCIDHVLSINKANIEVQKGNFSSWLINKERQDGFELAENKRLQKDIRRLKQAARQSSDWADKAESSKMGKGAEATRKKGHFGGGSKEYKAEKSRKMQQRRKNIETRQQSAIAEKSGLLKNVEITDNLKLITLVHHAKQLVSLENISIFYGNNIVCRDFCLTIERGQRIALCGKNGSGKSSILKLIYGEDIPHKGNFHIASGLKISYVSQDTSFLSGDLSDYACKHQIDESLFKAILRKLDFSRTQFDKNMTEFSAGQKKKVLLAKSLCERAHLYIWDEPLNFVDVLSRIQLEELLLEYEPTMIFVEHDSTFVEKIATDIVRL